MSGTRLSGRLALWLMAALSLLFAIAVLFSAGSFFPGEPASVAAADAAPERTLTGRNAPDQIPLEMLPGERIDLNSADELELQKLPGIGEGLSAAIVADREENGPFSSVEDLLRVPGIGEKRLAAIRDLVTVGPEA
jgi:competence ComEA-like helix-hairpin-helix protein